MRGRAPGRAPAACAALLVLAALVSAAPAPAAAPTAAPATGAASTVLGAVPANTVAGLAPQQWSWQWHGNATVNGTGGGPPAGGYVFNATKAAADAAAAIPRVSAVSQLGKRKGRRDRHGHNYSVSEIAAELRLMPSLAQLDPQAVCNDGSPGVYYYKKGYNPGLWLMYIAGGPTCYDERSCTAQPAYFTGTTSAPHAVFLSGIFTSSGELRNTQFADANTIWVSYCSSDAWAGDAAANFTGSNNLFPGGFRGQRILAATLRSMVKFLEFGATQSTRLLFGGCTPGAVYNLDVVANTIRGLGIKEEMVTVQGIFDSAAVVDVPPLSPTALSLANITELAYDAVNASGVASPACLAAFADAPWRCLLGSDALAHVQSPYLLVQSQFDRAQLMYNAPRPGHSAASVAYADAFQAASLDMLQSLPTAAQPHSALFSSACFSYCTSLSAHFWNVAVQGGPVARPGLASHLGQERLPPVTLETVVNWWFFKAQRGVRVVADCTGFRCGQCKANTLHKAKPKSRLETESASLAGPLILGTFMLLLSAACCIACAVNEPRRRRGSLLRGGAEEETPLLSSKTRSSSRLMGVQPVAGVQPTKQRSTVEEPAAEPPRPPADAPAAAA